MLKWLFAITWMICSLVAVNAQEVKLAAQLDTNLIRIGEQMKLTLSAQYNVKNGTPVVAFPVYKDTIITGIEIISQANSDTALVDPTNDPYTFKQTKSYLLTSYDSGVYVIPGLPFVINGNEQLTNALAIQVATIAIDTTKGIVDIMEPMDLPITFGEYLNIYKSYIYWAIALIALLVLIWWLIKKYKARPVKEVEEVIPDIAPHIWALEKIQALKGKNYFEQGNAKQHYVELTTILRAYFEKRYQFLALEITSDEILREIRLFGWKTEQQDSLRRLLTLADLVKFAKETPTKSDVDWSLHYVEQLIESIKIEEQEQPDTDENNA